MKPVPLFDDLDPDDPMVVAFREFDERNPHVYEKLVEIARFIKGRGHRRFGVKALFERLRWVSLFHTAGDDYKLNNNYTAFYARRLNHEPGLEGMFEVRYSRADEADV